MYNSFINQLSEIIDDVAPLREIRVKNNTPDLFDGEIKDEIKNRNKSTKNSEFLEKRKII